VTQGAKQNLAKLAKIEIKMLPLIWRNSVRTFGEMILKVKEAIQEIFKLVELANVYAISELIE
jgi:hypothetical protein